MLRFVRLLRWDCQISRRFVINKEPRSPLFPLVSSTSVRQSTMTSPLLNSRSFFAESNRMSRSCHTLLSCRFFDIAAIQICVHQKKKTVANSKRSHLVHTYLNCSNVEKAAGKQCMAGSRHTIWLCKKRPRVEERGSHGRLPHRSRRHQGKQWRSRLLVNHKSSTDLAIPTQQSHKPKHRLLHHFEYQDTDREKSTKRKQASFIHHDQVQ
jgi:hypothetical protein